MNTLIPRFEALLRGDRLKLRGWRIGPAGARDLAALPGLDRVRVLELTGNRIGDAGLQALIPALGAVAELHLGDNALTAAGLGSLASLASLTELHIDHNTLGPPAIEALRPVIPRLEIFDFTGNSLGDLGARMLAEAGLRAEEVQLEYTGLGPAGLAALVPVLGPAHALLLSGNPLGDAGAEALAALAATTTGFSSLTLGWVGLSAAGLARLLDSGLFQAGISHLALRGNPLGEAGLRLLAEHPKLPSTTLHLSDGPPEVVRAIRARTRAIVAVPVDAGLVLTCPYCCEPIDPDVALCPHCHEDTSRDAPSEERISQFAAVERRPCLLCGHAMQAHRATRCPGCASWVVDAEERARHGR